MVSNINLSLTLTTDKRIEHGMNSWQGSRATPEGTRQSNNIISLGIRNVIINTILYICWQLRNCFQIYPKHLSVETIQTFVADYRIYDI